MTTYKYNFNTCGEMIEFLFIIQDTTWSREIKTRIIPCFFKIEVYVSDNLKQEEIERLDNYGKRTN